MRDLLAKIEQLAPNDPDVCMNVDFVVACPASQEGHKEEAVKRFEDILKNYRQLLKTDAYFRGSIERRRAFCLTNLGRYREAISVLNSASARAMSSADEQQEIHLWLGICLTELDERETAKQEFLHAIDLGLKNEREADARYRLSGLYYSDGALAEAKSQLESILRHRSESTSYLPRAYIYRRLSKVYHFMGDEENSRRYKKLEEDCSYVIH